MSLVPPRRAVNAIQRLDIVQIGESRVPRHAPDHSGIESKLHTAVDGASADCDYRLVKRLRLRSMPVNDLTVPVRRRTIFLRGCNQGLPVARLVRRMGRKRLPKQGED